MILKLIKKQQQQNNHDSHASNHDALVQGKNQLLLPIKQEGIENTSIIHIV